LTEFIEEDLPELSCTLIVAELAGELTELGRPVIFVEVDEGAWNSSMVEQILKGGRLLDILNPQKRTSHEVQPRNCDMLANSSIDGFSETTAARRHLESSVDSKNFKTASAS
jgi:hypothetical protein